MCSLEGAFDCDGESVTSEKAMVASASATALASASAPPATEAVPLITARPPSSVGSSPPPSSSLHWLNPTQTLGYLDEGDEEGRSSAGTAGGRGSSRRLPRLTGGGRMAPDMAAALPGTSSGKLPRLTGGGRASAAEAPGRRSEDSHPPSSAVPSAAASRPPYYEPSHAIQMPATGARLPDCSGQQAVGDGSPAVAASAGTPQGIGAGASLTHWSQQPWVHVNDGKEDEEAEEEGQPHESEEEERDDDGPLASLLPAPGRAPSLPPPRVTPPLHAALPLPAVPAAVAAAAVETDSAGGDPTVLSSASQNPVSSVRIPPPLHPVARGYHSTGLPARLRRASASSAIRVGGGDIGTGSTDVSYSAQGEPPRGGPLGPALLLRRRSSGLHRLYSGIMDTTGTVAAEEAGQAWEAGSPAAVPGGGGGETSELSSACLARLRRTVTSLQPGGGGSSTSGRLRVLRGTRDR